MFVCIQNGEERPAPKSISALFLCESLNRPALHCLALRSLLSRGCCESFPQLLMRTGVWWTKTAWLQCGTPHTWVQHQIYYTVKLCAKKKKNNKVSIVCPTINWQQLIFIKCKLFTKAYNVKSEPLVDLTNLSVMLVEKFR